MTGSSARQDIRELRDADAADVIGIWHRAGIAAYTYLPTWQAFTLEQADRVFRDTIRPRCAVWVGTSDERIVAYMAMSGSYIDRLYVDPPVWRRGWGPRFVNFAKTLSPSGLELATHQENWPARSLYERHGFIAVRFGVSPPPESAPDVEYWWRPSPLDP